MNYYRNLEGEDLEEAAWVLKKTRVFARMTPNDKAVLNTNRLWGYQRGEIVGSKCTL